MQDQTLADALEAAERFGGVRPAARALGIPYTTFQGRVKRAKAAAVTPELPADWHEPIADIIERQATQVAKRREVRRAREWFPVKVAEARPIGILWFGDPHIDDDSCDMDVLLRHVELCRETPGLYGANIGDTTNNWVGRLTRLFGDQEASQETARRLAKWFLVDSGVNWLLTLVGNHDAWNEGGEILSQMNSEQVPLIDWAAKFRLVFKNGRSVRIHAAHDFKGSSIWNKTHGPSRAAQTGAADLYVCGHRHDWGIQHYELPETDRAPVSIRCRGYKGFDHYAVRSGYAQSRYGAAILTVIDPTAETPDGLVTPFANVETGARYLNMLRGA